ncbi:hypothetical protein GQ53DRAFT_768056 [Thozetella sp. PMI_491]|nr:hypothetical protein GQ53DRAFT_768056 [Thozetella sp. PMI_491]
MASLKFIIDAVDDQLDYRGIQKAQDPAVSAHPDQDQGPLPQPSLPAAATTSRPSHVSSPGDTIDHRIPSPAVPSSHRPRRGGPSPRGSLSNTPSSTLTFSRDRPARRWSTASNDSMEQGGYGSTASSSSMGGSLNPSNSPMRPMPAPPVGEMPVKLTPITGRVSRAKKGMPVHTCDICKPPKTFTRAEHLRRHQLSHQTPGFPCRYPGCDRAFHRSDLLTRHLQRHEQEGDKMRSSGEDEDRRTSLASSSQSHMQVDDGYGTSSVVVSGQGTGAVPPSQPGVQDLPSTPNPAANQASPYTQLGSSPTPHQINGGSGGFRSPVAGSQDYSGYTLSPRAPTVSVIHPRGPSSMPGPGFPSVLDPYQQPRTTPPSIFVVTQGLSRPSPQIPDNAPELYPHDNSPYVSSASDSTYSTPVSDISRGPRFQWVQSRPSPQPEWPPQLLSPYPGATSRELSGASDVMVAATSPPLFVNHFPPSAHFTATSQPHSFANMLDVSMTGYPSADPHHQMLGPGPESAYRPHSGHPGNPAASVRSPTPPPNTSSHTTDALVTPTPALPSRLDGAAGLGRQKEVAVEIAGEHHDLVGMDALAGLGGAAFPGHVSPGASGDGVAALTALELSLSACGGPAPTISIPLPRPVRAAIPEYLEVYWARVHRVFPVVHRPSFESAPEDVLRCAMAALATQYLEGKEDRNKGNQLHEYAWQEAKRIPQWSLQVMQAILLCEYFARFRGRKAVTRPSKLFESLYSRDTSSAWSPASSPISTSSSESDCATPTSSSPSPYAAGIQSFGVLPGSPFGSFPPAFALPPPPAAFSTSPPLFPSSYYSYNVSSLNGFPLSSARSGPKRRLQWSSLFAPDPRSRPRSRFQPPPRAPPGAAVTGQSYLPHTSTQALYHNPAMFDPAVLNPDQHVVMEERWQAWLDAEARRRLLTACFVVDVHTSLLQQQRRAHECSLGGTGAAPPPIPLTGRSSALWEATSAEQWNAMLEADPTAGSPAFVPQTELLTPKDMHNYNNFDCAAILAVETLRLPVLPPQAELDLHAPHSGSQFHPGHQIGGAVAADAEERIAALFTGYAPAYTYLAMHHTPLHDLLAVSGDSWVFSQKVLVANSFLEHKKRLKVWAEQQYPGPQQHLRPSGGSGAKGRNATKATIYAAKAILAFLNRTRTSGAGEGTAVQSGPGLGRWSYDISDYWGMYVCALICWAFSHRARAGGDRGATGGSGELSPQRSSTSSLADEDALTWLRAVADMCVEDVARVRGRREAAGVVGLVRRRLEMDCVGGKSRLYVDAVGVLKKLEEGANWKWF